MFSYMIYISIRNYIIIYNSSNIYYNIDNHKFLKIIKIIKLLDGRHYKGTNLKYYQYNKILCNKCFNILHNNFY